MSESQFEGHIAGIGALDGLFQGLLITHVKFRGRQLGFRAHRTGRFDAEGFLRLFDFGSDLARRFFQNAGFLWIQPHRWLVTP